MSIYRNKKFADQLNISPATIANWITKARKGLLNLQLSRVQGKYYLLDTEHNQKELLRLKLEGEKFKPKSKLIRISPDPELYKIFSNDQLLNLFINLKYNNFIPVKYSYIGPGAYHYHNGLEKAVISEGSIHFIEHNLISTNFKSILRKKMNESGVKNKTFSIVELGSDESTKSLSEGLSLLENSGLLNSYISVGLSEDMHNIRTININDNRINCINHTIDIEESLLSNTLLKHKLENNTVNFLTLLSGSIGNIPNVQSFLANLSKLLTNEDYLFIDSVLTDDNGVDKIPNKSTPYNTMRHEWLFDMLGLMDYIDIEYYGYDSQNKVRNKYLVMKKDVTIDFEIDNKTFSLNLQKDQKIVFFVSYRYTLNQFLSYFNNLGLVVDQFNTDESQKLGLFLLRKADSKF